MLASPAPGGSIPTGPWRLAEFGRFASSFISLGLQPYLPLPRKDKGDNPGQRAEVPRRALCQAWHCDYSDYESVFRAEASTAAPRASWVWPSASPPGGRDLGGKQAGIWLRPMRSGNWTLGREDCPGLWARTEVGVHRDSMCVCTCTCVSQGTEPVGQTDIHVSAGYRSVCGGPGRVLGVLMHPGAGRGIWGITIV